MNRGKRRKRKLGALADVDDIVIEKEHLQAKIAAQRTVMDAKAFHSEDVANALLITFFIGIFVWGGIVLSTGMQTGWKLLLATLIAMLTTAIPVFFFAKRAATKRSRAITPAAQDWARRCLNVHKRCEAFNRRLEAMQQFAERSEERYTADIEQMADKYAEDREALLAMLDGINAEEPLLLLEQEYDVAHEPSARLTRELTEPLFISKVRIDNAALEQNGPDVSTDDPRFQELEAADAHRSNETKKADA